MSSLTKLAIPITDPRPGLTRAKSGSFTEKIRRTLSRSGSRSPSTTGPNHALSKMISRITVEDVKSAKRIGGGGFGEVYVLGRPTKDQVALKRLREDDLRHHALREGDTWAKLQHPNVLPFLGFLETPNDLYLISPYVKNGSLVNYIGQHSDVDRRILLWEAASAIAFLHKAGIVHGDIKAANILVSDDIHALLCDFGLAKSVTTKTSTALHGAGTVQFESPELLEGEGKTFASDVWAFGMTIYQVLSDKMPFSIYETDLAVITAVLKNARPPRFPRHSTSGESYKPLWRVAKDCWQKDPVQRLSMESVHVRLGEETINSSQWYARMIKFFRRMVQAGPKTSPPAGVRLNVED